MKNVVLIHGMWCNGKTLSRVSRYFKEKGFSDVRCPCLPNHAPFTAPTAELGSTTILSYRDFLIDTEEIGPDTILVGHSMGGLLAQMVAATVPVRAVVLLAPAGARGVNHLNSRTICSSREILLTWKFWKRAYRPSYALAREVLFNMLDEATAHQIYESLSYESGRVYSEIGFWMLDRLRATAIDFDAIDVPMILLAGTEDRLVVPAIAEQICSRYSDCEYHELAGLGHWLFEESERESVYSALDVWLSKHDLLPNALESESTMFPQIDLPLAQSLSRA